MAALANQKQEKYAQQRASGLIPSKAAIAAGYAPGSAIAVNLERDDDVKARIEELYHEKFEQRERARQATIRAAEVVGEITGITHAWVIQQLVEVAGEARGDGDFKEANSSLKMIGEHLGMWSKLPADVEGNGEVANSMAEKALERLDRLSEGMAHLDMPAKTKALPDSRDIATLVGKQGTKRPVEVLTGSEADIALHPMSDIDPSDIPQ